MPTRIISAVSAGYENADGEQDVAAQGQEVDVSAAEAKRLEEANALVPEGFDSFAAYSDYLQDSYRAGRGDTDALKRLSGARGGGVVELGGEGDTAAYIDWLTNESPSVDETVAAADGDPAKAAAILEAENNVTGGEPRAGVVKGLEKITNP